MFAQPSDGNLCSPQHEIDSLQSLELVHGFLRHLQVEPAPRRNLLSTRRWFIPIEPAPITATFTRIQQLPPLQSLRDLPDSVPGEQAATIPAVQHSLLQAVAPKDCHLSQQIFYLDLGREIGRTYAGRKVADELEEDNEFVVSKFLSYAIPSSIRFSFEGILIVYWW